MSSRNNVKLDEVFPLMEEKLNSGGKVTFKPHGISMLPLIRQGRDSVVIEKIDRNAKIGDVIFFRRPNGQFVLHRVIGKDKNGYILCGDNQWQKERGVREEWIIGIMIGILRDGIQADLDCERYRKYIKHLKYRRPLLFIKYKGKRLKEEIVKRIK
ncbi:MAG: S24/S26 family peptidase [Clostridia bacterium]|nr:S24/S26 family peptidase [Clostridia bacterium]